MAYPTDYFHFVLVLNFLEFILVQSAIALLLIMPLINISHLHNY